MGNRQTEAKKEIQRRKARNVLIRRGEDGEAFLLYIETIFKHHYKKVFRRTWWDGLMAQALMDIYWGMNDRLIIEMPPRHGKTERGVRQFASYSQGLDASIKFQYSTYGSGLSVLTSSETKEIMEAVIYKEMFPNLQFSSKLNKKEHWLLTAGGGLLGTSVGGAVTGMGAEISIPDDLLKADDADSKARRDEAYKFFNASTLTRLEGRKAIILIMQRLHEDDVVGRVEAKTGLVENGGDWEKLSLPVINDFESFESFFGWIERKSDKESEWISDDDLERVEAGAEVLLEKELIEFDRKNPNEKTGHRLKFKKKRASVTFYNEAKRVYLESNDIAPTIVVYRDMRVLRPPLTPLDDGEYGLDYIVKMRKEMSLVEFKRQYMQDAGVSEAGHFDKNDFTYVTDVEIPEQNLYITIDNAESEEKAADNRAIVVTGKSVDASQVVLTLVMDGAFGLWEVYETCAQTIAMMIKYPTAPVYIEGAGGGITMSKVLKREVLIANAKLQMAGKPQINNGIFLFKPDNQTSKNAGIKLMTNPLEQHTLKFYKFMDSLFLAQIETEFKKFNPEKKNNEDDCIDALSKTYILPDCTPKINLPPKPKPVQRHNKRGKAKTWRNI